MVEINKEKLDVLYLLTQDLEQVRRYADHDPKYHESTLEHTRSMMAEANSILAMKPDLALRPRYLQAIIMAHDLGERGLTCDHSAFAQANKKEASRLKQEHEDKQFNELGKSHPWILSLRDDFENIQTAEAALANLLDKMDSLRHIVKNGVKKLTEEQAKFTMAYHAKAVERFEDMIENFPQLAGILLFAKSLLNFLKAEYRANGLSLD